MLQFRGSLGPISRLGRGHTGLLFRTQVALLLAYCGTRYQGLQKNPGAVTVEETLEAAIHRAGGITDNNVGTLQKVSWSRAGRTDKGVHAVGQIIGAKLVGLDLEALRSRVNDELEGSEVRVLGLERATQGFCAHTMCSSREYEYLLPAYVLRPPRAAPRAAAPVDDHGAAAAKRWVQQRPLIIQQLDGPFGRRRRRRPFGCRRRV